MLFYFPSGGLLSAEKSRKRVIGAANTEYCGLLKDENRGGFRNFGKKIAGELGVLTKKIAGDFDFFAKIFA